MPQTRKRLVLHGIRKDLFEKYKGNGVEVRLPIPTYANSDKKEAGHDEYIELDSIPVTTCWTGRAEELELFIRPGTNVIEVSGVGGQGKTALASEFMKRDIERYKRFDKRIWVDWSYLRSDAGCLCKLKNLI